MAKEGSYGYKNNKGVYIKSGDKSDGDSRIDFYSDRPDNKPHESIHISVSNGGKFETYSNVGGEEKKSSGSCYLTSACMKHYLAEFNDNCYELNVLRWFRDNYITKEEIEDYYKIAPSIVDAIDVSEHKDLIYYYIYDNIVNYCVRAIEEGDYDNAYSRYRSSIYSLEETFIKNQLQKELTKTFKN